MAEPAYVPVRPVADRLLLVEAACWLAIAFLLVRCVPFRRYIGWLGRPHRESPRSLPPDTLRTAARLRWAVFTAQARVPWRCTCLMRVMAARKMFVLRRVPCTIYLGAVVKSRDDAMAAHAWLRTGDAILLGARAAPQYRALTGFS